MASHSVNKTEEMKDWLNEFFAIPDAYRCNPFDYSPSGDLFFADKRNIEVVKKGLQQAKDGKVKRLSIKEFFG